MTDDRKPVQPGDFFECSWGYDQTNVDFYEVVGVTPSGKSVKVVGVGSRTVSDTGSTTYVAPRPNTNPDARVMTKRLRPSSRGGWAFTVNSYSDAYLWDGTPQYETGSGWGH